VKIKNAKSFYKMETQENILKIKDRIHYHVMTNNQKLCANKS